MPLSKAEPTVWDVAPADKGVLAAGFRPPSRARRALARVATMLSAWLVAFLVVTVILSLFRDQLAGLSPVLEALVFTAVLVGLMANLMPVLGAAVARRVGGPGPKFPRGIGAADRPNDDPPPRLPRWPTQTIAVLCTLDHAPHAIPVSAPLRAGDRRILISLHRGRESLAWLRDRPQVALAVLAEGDVAVTARGRAWIAEEPMAQAPDYAAIAIEVEHIDDHRQAMSRVVGGVQRHWLDEREKRALGERVTALGRLAATRPEPRREPAAVASRKA